MDPVTEIKKSKRAYNSARRQAQARETRRQIITAARQLFIQYGYNGATIEAIAQEAGVAPETVFSIFGNKRTILAELFKFALGGDDQPTPLLERDGPQAVLHEPDPRRRLHLFAEDISKILARVAPLFEVLRAAAKTEPDIDAMLKKILEDRLNTMGQFVRIISARDPLRPELDEAQATATVWSITSPELYSLLTVDLGWSRQRYVQWLGDTLVRLLLP